MSLTITITDAGRQALVNAENSGTAPVTIAGIALGSGQYTPSATQTALTNEFKRIDTISGEVVADDTINVVLKDESSDDYQVGEFGLFTDAGVLFAVFSQPSGSGWVAEKNAGSSLLLAVDVVLETLDATSLTFGDLTFTNPPASETVKGVIEIANIAEARAGTDDVKAMTPKKARMVGVPPGAIMPFAQSAVPAGYLKCNGAAVSRFVYADLFSAIGAQYGAGNGAYTFNLPDLRGEFVRGWDDGRGVDAGRGVGQLQDDLTRSHSHAASSAAAGSHGHSASSGAAGNHAHSGKADTAGSHTHTQNNYGWGDPRANYAGASNYNYKGKTTLTDAAGNHTHSLSINAAGNHSHPVSVAANGSHEHGVTVSAAGGSETRPRNIALPYCIKY